MKFSFVEFSFICSLTEMHRLFFSGCCHFQIYALKALVRSFLPHQVTHVKRQINDLLDILSEMLLKGYVSYDTGSWYRSKLVISDIKSG